MMLGLQTSWRLDSRMYILSFFLLLSALASECVATSVPEDTRDNTSALVESPGSELLAALARKINGEMSFKQNGPIIPEDSEAAKQYGGYLMQMLAEDKDEQVLEQMSQHHWKEPTGQVIIQILKQSGHYSGLKFDRLSRFLLAAQQWPDDNSIGFSTRSLYDDKYELTFRLEAYLLETLAAHGLASKMTIPRKGPGDKPLQWLEAQLRNAKGKVDAKTDEAVDRALCVVAEATLAVSPEYPCGITPATFNGVSISSSGAATSEKFKQTWHINSQVVTPRQYLLWALAVLASLGAITFLIKRKTEG